MVSFAPPARLLAARHLYTRQSPFRPPSFARSEDTDRRQPDGEIDGARSPSFRPRCRLCKAAFSGPFLTSCCLFRRRSCCSFFEHLLIVSCASRYLGSLLYGTTRRRTESSIGNAGPSLFRASLFRFKAVPFQACSVPSLFRLSCLDQMEAAMRKLLVTAIASLAIISGSLLVANRAEAGASASAPSKYSNQAASAHQVQTARHERFAIMEYSSSSAKNHRH